MFFHNIAKCFVKQKRKGELFCSEEKTGASLPLVKQFCQTPTFSKRKRIFRSTSGFNCCFRLFLKRKMWLKSVCFFMEKMQNEQKSSQKTTQLGVEFFGVFSSVVQGGTQKKNGPTKIMCFQRFQKSCVLSLNVSLRT